MIIHTVVFRLNHASDSPEEKAFLQAALKLTSIPGVRNFQRLRQMSKKNIYQLGFSMEFANAEDYQGYNEHPDHIAFVENRWKKEVSDFMEIDYEPID